MGTRVKITKPDTFEVGPPPTTVRLPPEDQQVKGSLSGGGKKRVINPNPPPTNINRLTVVEMLYHQQGVLNPESFQHNYSRELKTDEQTYGPRRDKVGEEWQELKLGWFSDKGLNCGLLRIVNEEGGQQQRIPTPEQLAETAAKVIEYCYKGGEAKPFLLHPQESCRVYPSNIEGLMIRCRKGVAKYTVVAFPE